MINTEMAFDLLPYAVEIFVKLDLQHYIKNNTVDATKLSKEEVEVAKNQAGINMIKHILKNTSKIKEEIFEIIALIDNKTVDEVKGQNILVTVNSFKNLLGKKELMDFFKQAMQ